MSLISALARAETHVRVLIALQGVDRFEIGWSLSRLPPLLAFLHLVSDPQIWRSRVPGL
jgi:hypothetical protein